RDSRAGTSEVDRAVTEGRVVGRPAPSPPPPVAKPVPDGEAMARKRESDSEARAKSDLYLAPEQAAKPMAAPPPPARQEPQRDNLAKRRAPDTETSTRLDQSTHSAAEAPTKPVPTPQTRQKAASPDAGPGAIARLQRAPIWSGFESQPPEKWIERIEDLRRAGRDPDAQDMLDEFKKRFPSHPLPATLAK